ncbi:MAG: hypothetical protein BM557_02250 [Flavobacterium sp. MedPE-SWcel]|uniref:tyrosine-type recombinase/integrase n=1 Tax=uncultured Flavobacterium sp. TaxID=165435 RepID=UPI00091DDA2A|nr:site-specific integrase [uncultured Flavobacterium sp.]OIQ22220.1 MAG: hypothetical protein BM557_02250 [Flavobacterium sp. MedPE-SWcel]
MKLLPFDCSYTDVWVSPKNWETISDKKASSENWYIQCVFYDPLFKEKYPKGFPFRKKLNRIKSLEKKKAAVKFLLEEIPRLFEEKGFNPITGKYMIENTEEEDSDSELGPSTPFLKALDFVYERLEIAKTTNNDIRLILIHFKKSAQQLRYDELAIKDVRRKHIKLIISNLEKTQGKFSGHKFNKYRGYLQVIFRELLEFEAVENNIITDIRKRTQVKTIRETLTVEERKLVNDHLKHNFPDFWIFLIIFFHSGGRITELLSVKIEDVDIENQKYRVLIKKGQQHTWVERVIKDIALVYWRRVLFGGKKSDYIFSVGLKPGESKIRTQQISRRWRTHVKQKLGVSADFYALKHINLDETVALLSMKEAAAMANHKSTKMLENHYAVGEKERQFARLKAVGNDFA